MPWGISIKRIKEIPQPKPADNHGAQRRLHWKLIEYEVFESTAVGGLKIHVRKTQLFNLADNPFELMIEHHDPSVIAVSGNQPQPQQVNLAHLPAYSERVQEMQKLLVDEQERLDDPYRFSDLPRVVPRP